MPNKMYKRGADKEYRIINNLRKQSFIAQRSAGSHSPWDVVAIQPERRVIMLIQSKGGSATFRQLKKLEAENQKFDGVYFVKFIAIKHSDDIFEEVRNVDFIKQELERSKAESVNDENRT